MEVSDKERQDPGGGGERTRLHVRRPALHSVGDPRRLGEKASGDGVASSTETRIRRPTGGGNCARNQYSHSIRRRQSPFRQRCLRWPAESAGEICSVAPAG